MSLSHRLGDARAEHDAPMLDTAFFETTEFHTLAESSDRCVIVGRRGSGKSALMYKLSKLWSAEPRTRVYSITPTDAQIYGIREQFRSFGDQYAHLQVSARTTWKYSLLMQICADLASHYKFSKKLPETPLLASRLREWGNPHEDITLKVRRYLKKVIVHDAPPQENIADLASVTSTKDIFAQLQELLTQTDLRVVLLIDRLDEGYTPDEVGIALVDGFVQAVIELNSHKPSSLDAYVFVRDNVFRAIAEKSVDFTRNIEGQVLRLSWNERNLFNVVCNRFRIAFADKTEKNLRV